LLLRGIVGALRRVILLLRRVVLRARLDVTLLNPISDYSSGNTTNQTSSNDAGGDLIVLA